MHLNSVTFVNDRNGLAVGGRSFEQTPSRVETFVVRTSDGGTTWTDISEHVKVGAGYLGGEYHSKVHWASSSHVYILTLGGRLIASETAGDTWKMTADFKDSRPNGFVSSTGYYKVLLSPRGQLAILAGAAGEEGYWGDLIVPNDRSSWTSYELARVPLSDALFLTEDTILACGKELYLEDETTRKRRPPAGVILYSNDRGKSWSRIHETRSNEAVVSLTRINDAEFYAISDAGSFMKFRLKR